MSINLKETNWRDLPAGDELDWVIAQVLGWEAKYKGHPTSLETAIYKGLLPNETALEVHRRFASGGVTAGFLQHYSKDLNVIGLLLLENGMHFHLCPPRDVTDNKYVALVTKDHSIDAFYGSASEEAPALALCKAWLAWKEKEGGL